MSGFGQGKKTVVQCVKDGPLIIRGPIELRDETGDVIDTGQLTSLCRCGRSQSYPLCDGRHAQPEAKT